MHIERGIPMPNRTRYPFSKMITGDSFVLPKDEYNRLTSAAWHFRKANPGWNYAVRSEGNSVRIWRLS